MSINNDKYYAVHNGHGYTFGVGKSRRSTISFSDDGKCSRIDEDTDDLYEDNVTDDLPKDEYDGYGVDIC